MFFDVKWFTNGMRGAPVVDGNTPGCHINLLDTLLLPTGGFGLTAALSVTVAGGLATASLNAGMSFERFAIVAIDGATGAYTGLNTEARVLITSSNSISWATNAPDGLATGAITIKYAPQGQWEKLFSKTNVAVYRSTHPLSKGHCVRVDDTGTRDVRIRVFESMSDVDTGTGPCPQDVQVSGGGYVLKSSLANTTAVKWSFFADGLLAYSGVSPYWVDATPRSMPLRGFGYPIALRGAGDDHLFALSAATTAIATVGAGTFSKSTTVASNWTQGFCCAPRGVSGLGAPVLLDVRPYTGISTAISGADTTLGAAPSNVDGALKLSPLYLTEQGATPGPRGELPGIHYVPQSGAYALLPYGSMEDGAGQLAGRKLFAVPAADGFNPSPSGVIFVDITGPWR